MQVVLTSQVSFAAILSRVGLRVEQIKL